MEWVYALGEQLEEIPKEQAIREQIPSVFLTDSENYRELLEEAGICRWDKHFSLVTPRDFMEYEKKEFVFEGSLRDLVRLERQGYAAGRLILHQVGSPSGGSAEQPVYPGTVYSGVTAYER